MGIAGGIIIFVILWWVFFLMVVPLGHNPPAEGEAVVPGIDRGAPNDPRLRLKVALATGLAVVATGLLELTIRLDLVEIPLIN